MIAAASLLSGCFVTDEIGSWFASSGKKSNLRGVRIPVMSLDENLKVDAEAAKIPIQLPPPYRNTEWPQPGGYASNAMYHLAAPGRLQRLWDADAGKGTDIDSTLTSTPVVADGMIFALDSEAPGAQERHRHADSVGPFGQGQHRGPAPGHGRRRGL